MIGIYAIHNTFTNKYYIGQSIHIKRRWEEHKSTLRNQRHENIHLQYSWNKYGESCFDFIVLEICKKN